jgi:translocation and assembly module TamB
LRRITAYLLAAALAVWPLTLSAQGDQSREDASFLERQIESLLSGEDRDVVIEGFQGLLGGQATFERLTISDRDGVWLTVLRGELDWSRLALLRRRLEVNRLSAEVIDFARPPAPSQTPPSPEASSGFSLPDLPVAVRINELSVDRLTLGEPLFGQAAELSLTGSAVLDGGVGQVSLTADRLDGDGQFRLAAGYTNETDTLDVSLVVDEAEDGVVVNLLDIPDLPSLRLVVEGSGPLSDFDADIVLSTDGVDRLAGRVLTRVTGPAEAPDRDFVVNLGGDVSALLLPEYRDFFGPSVILGLDATRAADGAIRIDDLDLQAEALVLSVRGEIGPDRLPTALDISGQIASRDGSPVLLPVPGAPVRVTSADIGATFDAAQGEGWQARIAVAGLDTEGLGAETVVVTGTGTIRPTRPDRRVTADIDLAATGVDAGGPDVGAALGRDLDGQLSLSWAEGGTLQIPTLRLSGADYSLAGSGEVSGFGEGLAIAADLSAEAGNLAAFSGLARRDLGGAVSAQLDLVYEALTGQFDIALDATSRDLRVDQPQADAVLAGAARLILQATRDETGTRVDTLRLTSPNADLSGQANLTSARSTASVEARLADIALVLPDLAGAVYLSADAEMVGDDWTYDATLRGAGVSATVDGTANTAGEVPRVDTALDLAVDDLSGFSSLIGRPLAGAVTATGRVSGLTDLSEISADLSGTSRDLAIGLAQVDAALAGETTYRVAGQLENDVPTVETLTLRNAALDLAASGSLKPGEGAAQVQATLFDTGLVLPGAEGRSTIDLKLDEGEDRVWTFDLDTTSPVLAAQATGEARPFDTPQALSADLNLSAPDLSLFSALAGRSLAGSVTAAGTVAGTSDLQTLNVDLTMITRNIGVGIAQVDQLLAGQARLVADASKDGDDITVRRLDLTAPQVNASVTGGTSAGAGTLRVSAALADLGLFVPEFPGRVTLDGTARLDGAGTAAVDLAATGPGGIRAQVTGTTATSFDRMNLRANGQAPLAIANTFIVPNSVDGTLGFDVSVNGPPELGSVSGTVSTSGARVVLPGAGIGLRNVAVNTRIAAGRADVSVTAAVEAGGSLSVTGPVQLAAPFDGTLDIALNNVVLTDPALYRTSLSGNLRMAGPLAGGASIGGNIVVGETEISIAGAGTGASGPIPYIRFLNEPAAVRQTRVFAGLVQEEDGRERNVATYPLDVTIDAQRIFVRGRGLDAELAGRLRVTGTTSNVTPVGAIELVRGRLSILGARLRVIEGEIVLEGSLVPVLRLRAISEGRSDADVQAFVQVDGPVTDPQFRFESEPPLPEDEVLAQLLFGTDLSNISALQAAQLAAAAATLAGGGPGVVGGLRSGLGIDDLDVRTDQQGRTAVTAGTYINDRLYADVTSRSDGETEVNLNFQVSPSVTVTGSTANTGESTVGIFFRRDY